MKIQDPQGDPHYLELEEYEERNQVQGKRKEREANQV